jgi:hypothetical protein
MVNEMSILEKQIFILIQLREAGANIQPVATHDFTDDILLKKLTYEEIKTCFSLLEKKKFIETITNEKTKGVFATFITDEGMEEIEKYEESEREKKRLAQIQLNIDSIGTTTLTLTWVLAISTAISAIYYLIEILKNLYCFY